MQASVAGVLMEALRVEQVHVIGPAGAVAYRGLGQPAEPYEQTTGEAPAWVAANRRPAVVDAERAAAGLGTEMTGRFGLAGAALLPFDVSGELRAVVALGGSEPRAWSPAEIEVASALLDVAGLATALAEVRAHARFDPLTGALSGDALRARLAEEIARARRGRAPVACLLVGLDDLPALAARHGRPVADALLRHVAAVLEGQFRATDQVARAGDAEFAVVLPDAAPPQADMVAERVLRLLRETHISSEEEGEQPLRASMGLAEWRGPDGPDQLLARAEAALRQARAAGGDLLVHAP